MGRLPQLGTTERDPAASRDQTVALVTGASRGIGEAVARRLAEDGLAVAVLDLDLQGAEAVAASIRDAGGSATAVRADVTRRDDVDTAIEDIVHTLGDPTVLVSNAGVLRDNLLFRMSDSDWNTVVDVHLTGAFLLCRAMQQFMVSRGWGRVVVLSSTSALGKRGQINYAAAKAGLQGLVRAVAIELGPFGVTANAVAPGYILTDMAQQTAQRLHLTVDELTAANLPSIPAGRPGVPGDVAQAVSFFVDERSSFINGQVLYVAGGPRN